MLSRGGQPVSGKQYTLMNVEDKEDKALSGGMMEYITVFVLAAFVGYEVISKVPSILHTPLMSGSNAIHGIILVGAMLIAGSAHGAAQMTLGLIAVILATLNVVGGFVVTDRMLEMFKSSSPRRQNKGAAAKGESEGAGKGSQSGSASTNGVTK